MQELLDGLQSIFDAVHYIVDSLVNFILWLPELFEVGNSILLFVPAQFMGVAAVVIVIYGLKLIFGGDNGN